MYINSFAVYLQSGILGFIDIESFSAVAAPAHILALKLCMDQLKFQQQALEVLLSYIRNERERLNGCTATSSLPVLPAAQAHTHYH